MSVAVVDPGVEVSGALGRALVDEVVGPLAQRRLDEAFGLAVGLRPVGAREAVSNLQFGASLRERLGTERRAVVGEQAPDAYPERSAVSDGRAQEAHGVDQGLVGIHLGKADARLIGMAD